jgi:hypothetical protein
VDEHFLYFFLLFKFAVSLQDSAVRFLPVLGALLLAPGCLDHSLKCLYAFTHPCVKLTLHGMQVVLQVLTEAGKEREGLHQILALEVVFRIDF